jgi:hypothetical protein
MAWTEGTEAAAWEQPGTGRKREGTVKKAKSKGRRLTPQQKIHELLKGFIQR